MNRLSSHQSTRTRQAGFTIIELLIATSVFSVMLIVITAAVLQFSRQYYKGVISSSTQATTRALIDEVNRSLQFNGSSFSKFGTNDGYCIGAKRYSYKLNQQVIDDGPNAAAHQSYHALVTDTFSGCNTGTPPLSLAAANFPGTVENPRELLGERMRLLKFDIVEVNDMYTVTVRVAYGDDDLLCSPSTTGDCTNPNSLAGVNNNMSDLTCRSTIGSQFCAVSELTTTTRKRVN
ncbi:MAG TPA: prepilin-type N-terminal cleavage/methylation domain-containing protein [Candidatus Saccharimonadales bacterium]|jgi:prepilin-type N-terminal cleavage/methylation domain-containing protein